MVAKIERLTSEQEASLPAFRSEYLAHGMSCEPADKPRAEAAFASAYRRIGKQPVPVIWVDSPVTASLAIAALKHLALKENGDSLGASLAASLRASLWASLGDSLAASLRDSLWDSLWASLGASLWDSLGASLGASLAASLGDSLRASLRASLRDSLRDSLWDSLWASLGASLWDSLGASLWDSLGASLGASLAASLRGSLGDSLGASLRDSLWDSLGDSQIPAQHTYWLGQQDLYWVAFYEFCKHIGAAYKPDAVDGLDIMREIGFSCMWWYPRDGVIIACERPSAIRMDERQRLHCEDGPAVSFRDGWAVHAIHGVRVSADVVERPETITLAAIDAERNSEIQRVMIERFGWDRYGAEGGAKVIDHDERWGTLCRRGDMLFLRVVNRSPEPDGSFRNYVLPVDAQLRPIPDEGRDDWGEPQKLTALNAVASTFGMRGPEYRAVVWAES